MHSIHLDDIDSYGNPPDAEPSFFAVFYLLRLVTDVFRGLLKIASRIASTVAKIIVAALMAYSGVGPLAAITYMLQEQRKQDQDNLETGQTTGFTSS